MAERDVAKQFTAALTEWRTANPGWTEREQMERFSPGHLWQLAGGRMGTDEAAAIPVDRRLYLRLLEIAGYLVPQEGEDG